MRLLSGSFLGAVYPFNLKVLTFQMSKMSDVCLKVFGCDGGALNVIKTSKKQKLISLHQID